MYSRKKIIPKISLIIPVYNEAKRIKPGLKIALSYLTQQIYPWEIIIVDDGSADSSTIQLNHSRVHVLRTQQNFGKGHAIRVGIEAAAGKYIVFSDIDFSVPITSLPQFIATLKTADIAIGSRRLSQSLIAQHQSWVRETLGRGFTKLSNFALGLHHSDLTCGFKAFRHQVARDLFSRQRLTGWAFDSEILFLAHNLRYRVREIPVAWSNNPATKVRLASDLINSFLDLIRIRLS